MAGYLFFIILNLFILYAIKRFAKEDFNFLARGILISLLIRFACIVLLEYFLIEKGLFVRIFGYQTPALFGDSGYYALRSWWMAQDWMGIRLSKDIIEQIDLKGYGYHGYLYFLAVLYRIFGFDTILSRLFTSFFGVMLAVTVYFIAKEIIQNPKTSRISFILVSFWPTLFLWSLTHLKDIVIAFAVAVFIFCMIRFFKTESFVKRIGYFLPIALILFLANMLRHQLLLLLIGLLIMAFVCFIRSNTIRSTLIIVCLISGILIFPNIQKLHVWNEKYKSFIIARHIGSVRTGGNIIKLLPEKYYFIEYNKGFAYDVPLYELLKVLLKAPLIVFLQPFPNRIPEGIKRVCLIFYMHTWYIVLFFSTLSFFSLLKDNSTRKETIVIFCFLLFSSFYIIIGTVNIGTIFRWRSLFEPFVLMLTACFLSNNFDRFKESRLIQLFLRK